MYNEINIYFSSVFIINAMCHQIRCYELFAKGRPEEILKAQELNLSDLTKEAAESIIKHAHPDAIMA